MLLDIHLCKKYLPNMKNMKINIINKYDELSYNEVIEKVLKNGLNILDKRDYGINIILVNSNEIQELNKTYRKKDYETDVLTFPDGYLNNLGDVFISLPKVIEQANEYGHSFERELGFLTVHGLLHTLGYEHDSEEDEVIMTDLQNRVLKKSGLNR
mgnify:CR=1 FL=1